MSNVYFARPVTLSGPSRRLTDEPTMVIFSGQFHFLTRSLILSGCPAGGFCGLATGHPPYFHGCFHDAWEGPTPADIAVQSFVHLLWRGVGILFEESDGCHDESGSAEAAHHRISIAESLLHWMQLGAFRQPIDGANSFSLNLYGQRRARVNGPAVHNHRASAA